MKNIDKKNKIPLLCLLIIVIIVCVSIFTISDMHVAKGTYAAPSTYSPSSVASWNYLCNNVNDTVKFTYGGVTYCCPAMYVQSSGTTCVRFTSSGNSFTSAYEATKKPICANPATQTPYDNKYCCNNGDQFLYVNSVATCCQGTAAECNKLNCTKYNRGAGCYLCNGKTNEYSYDPDGYKCMGEGSCKRTGSSCSSSCVMNNRGAGCYNCGGNSTYSDSDPDFDANRCDNNRVCTKTGSSCDSNTPAPTTTKSCYCNTCINDVWDSYELKKTSTKADCDKAVSACTGTNAVTSWGYTDTMNRCPTVNNHINVDGYQHNDAKKLIHGIDGGVTKSVLVSKIDTNGTVSILDKNMNVIDDERKICTGYTLRVVFESDVDHPFDYKLSVRGDVLVTGELSLENGKMIARHIIDKNFISGEEYLMAADYDGNGLIKMNDVIKMLRDMYND